MENYSFRPSINEIDENAYNKIKQKRNEKDNQDKIINFNKYYEDLIKKTKEKQMKYNIMEEFPFQPIINHNNIKESFSNRLKLYENQSKEKMNKIKEEVEEMNKNLSKPVLYKNKKYIQKKVKDNNNKNNEMNNNQTNNINKTNNNIQKNKNMNNANLKNKNININIKSNSKINIIDNSSENSNKKNDIYKNKFIYDKINEGRMKKKELERKSNEYSNTENIKMNKSSNDLLINKKEKSFKKLFLLLDGDEDGIIKSSAINVERVSKGVQEILKNLFRQIKEENECLDESEFIYICEEYFKMLPYEKQNIFVNFENENNSNYYENYTFMPQINENSRKIDKNIE